MVIVFGHGATMDPRELATTNEILRGVVGSTAHGTAIDGQDDRDEMGVFIEPPENVCGLTPCEHYIYRDKPEGVRSGPGDLDLTLYSLRKFCRLAAGGNPSVVILLWLPAHIIKTLLGAELIGMREAFISKVSGARFLGYLVAQKLKMKGERAHTVSRRELVAKYGYDTKFAMHALRLGYEGIEFLTHRRLTLPVAEPNLTTLRAVRSGKINEAGALDLIEDAEVRLHELVDRCTWEPDNDAIDEFMVRAHLDHWRLSGAIGDASGQLARRV
jgi:predicted nucleotidyltransferase